LQLCITVSLYFCLCIYDNNSVLILSVLIPKISLWKFSNFVNWDFIVSGTRDYGVVFSLANLKQNLLLFTTIFKFFKSFKFIENWRNCCQWKFALNFFLFKLSLFLYTQNQFVVNLTIFMRTLVVHFKSDMTLFGVLFTSNGYHPFFFVLEVSHTK
jgi:hypothetical protein